MPGEDGEGEAVDTGIATVAPGKDGRKTYTEEVRDYAKRR
jgi:hypothetical protein